MLDIWREVLGQSFQSVWSGVAVFVPNLIIAIIIFIIGLIVGGLVGRLVAHVIRALKIDMLVRKANAEDYFSRAGIKLDIGKFIGVLVQWFIVITFLLASLEILHLDQVTVFLQDVILQYLPRVIVAVLILVAAVIIADAMQKVVVHASRAVNIRSSNLLGAITKWAIWIFAILAALFQLGIAATFVQTLFTGVIIALSLAAGLAFGLGGQSAASDLIEKVRDNISDKK